MDKSGSTYEFRMIIKEGIEKDQDIIDLMKLFATELSENVFEGKTVDIHLCNESFKTLRVVVSGY